MNWIDIKPDNINDYPAACFISPKHEHFRIKEEWFRQRYKEGLRIKQLYLDLEKTKLANAFVEYIPGENAWRAVDAAGYLFIHCIWVYPNKHKQQGIASGLLQMLEKEAIDKKLLGLATISSSGGFMADPDLFSKNSFTLADEYLPKKKKDPSFQLLVKQFENNSSDKQGGSKSDFLPKFRNWESELEKYQGWHILYSLQCPWVARLIREMEPVLDEFGLSQKIAIKELTTAKQAQKAPSLYSVFNLIHDGKLLADRYISLTRLKNILKQELD